MNPYLIFFLGMFFGCFTMLFAVELFKASGEADDMAMMERERKEKAKELERQISEYMLREGKI